MNFAAKIVKAERSDKCKTQFCDLPLTADFLLLLQNYHCYRGNNE